MPKPDFSDARLKLARAREHIADVESCIGTFLSTDFYKIRFENDQRERRTKIVLDSLHKPDKRVNAIIGDAVSNLRSVLDYVAVALVEPIRGGPDGIGFPFADDIKGFTGEVTKGSISVCGVVIRDHFISDIQAYKGGTGHAFWALNKLRNIDKHRFLITTASLAGIKCSFRNANGIVFTDASMGIVAGQSGILINAPTGHIEFTDNPRPVFEVNFAESVDVRESSAVKFLHLAARKMESCLSALDVIV